MSKRNPNMQAVLVHVDRDVYTRAKEIAYKADQSIKGWMAHCINGAVMNWKDPVTRKRAKTSSGLECMVCGCDSNLCRHPDLHRAYEWIKPIEKAVAANS